MAGAGDKTEEATPFKRQKARKKGQVARSRELPAALALIAIVMVLDGYARGFLGQWGEFFGQSLAMARGDNPENMIFVMERTARVTGYWALPCLLIGLAVSVFGNVGQGGVVFATEPLSPSFSRVNPMTNLGKLFSISAVSNLLKSIIPMAIITYLVFAMLTRDWDWVVRSCMVPAHASIAYLLERIYEISWKSGAVFLAWSGFDYLFQRTQLSRQLRMTKQEVTQENKDNLGNPQIKRRIRKVQLEMRRKMMMRDVAKATVVITNPTEYAIALKYQPGVMRAPVVVAKGRNLIAQQIRREALWHNIPIIENRPLAHALYRTVQVGQAIPPALYVAVAEILAFIFKARTGGRKAGAAKPAPPTRKRT
ncbi:MAG TPA: EscU/YscU/HrcU family type III secretion system export apparatus switch protein [Terriglobia bacterium]|nr:EscU/YscU/HrcU family type III secretion system export apparatus switch protein [Terriglobia bacterium]